MGARRCLKNDDNRHCADSAQRETYRKVLKDNVKENKRNEETWIRGGGAKRAPPPH